MIASWMLYALLVSVLLAAAATLLDALLALYRLPRRGVWVAAVVASVALPLMALLPSSAPADTSETALVHTVSGDVALGVTVATPAQRGGLRNAVVDAATAVRSAVRPVTNIAVSVPAQLDHPLASTLLAGAWLTGSAALLLLLLLATRRFLRGRSAWQSREVDRTRVYVTRNDGPAVVGLRRPSIIVPAWLFTLSDEQQRMVVRHEDEHVRRGDHVLMTSAAVLAALLPWNLPLHWMLSRLRLAVELDCDRRVLAAGASPKAYGAMLIEIAGRTHTLPLAVSLTRGESELERRIRAMTWKTPGFRAFRAALSVATAALLVLVACDIDTLDPALQQSTVGDVVDAAVAAQPTIAAAAGTARFYVDGSEVSLDDIRSRKVQEFARVAVVKPEQSASGRTEVRMTTAAQLGASQEISVYAGRASAVEAERSAVEVRAGRAIAAGEIIYVDTVPARAAGRAAAVQPSERRIVIDGGLQPSRAEVEARAATTARLRAEAAADIRSGEVAVTGAGRRVLLPADSTASVRLRTESGAAMTIRGAQSIAPEDRPLFIVDGVIVSGNAFDNLRADDIDVIEIIKGPAAQQMYGARAANGVVFITTKKR